MADGQFEIFVLIFIMATERDRKGFRCNPRNRDKTFWRVKVCFIADQIVRGEVCKGMQCNADRRHGSGEGGLTISRQLAEIEISRITRVVGTS